MTQTMVNDASRRRAGSSPYSRTGLFPWGNTYEVPARADGPWLISQTPCHLRNVRLAAERADMRQTARCGACGRMWTLRINTHQAPLMATWTA
jgi:hypothetical protein